jgi:hypothetical protein
VCASRVGGARQVEESNRVSICRTIYRSDPRGIKLARLYSQRKIACPSAAPMSTAWSSIPERGAMRWRGNLACGKRRGSRPRCRLPDSGHGGDWLGASGGRWPTGRDMALCWPRKVEGPGLGMARSAGYSYATATRERVPCRFQNEPLTAGYWKKTSCVDICPRTRFRQAFHR